MQRTNIYLDDRQIELLDLQARDQGLSRAELIRRIVDRSLAGADDDLAADLAAIDFSFGALPSPGIGAGSGLGSGASGDREEHLARLWRA